MRRFGQGSTTKQGIIREQLEEIWQLSYNLKDTRQPSARIRQLQKDANRINVILNRDRRQRDKRIEKQQVKFREEYYYIKNLFAFGSYDDALKAITAFKKKWGRA